MAVVATSTHPIALGFPFQRKGFYAAGRYWAFYSNGTNGYYESTTDPTDWSGVATSIGTCSIGERLAIWYDSVNNFVHYVRYDAYRLYYRRGTPQSDGTISWSAVEQLVYNGNLNDYYAYPSICVDTNGYAWIGVLGYDGSHYYPYILKNSANDGTWGMDVGYPRQLNGNSNTWWRVQPIPLTSGKLYVIYGRSGVLVCGQVYDGVNWGAEETDLGDFVLQAYYFCGVAEGDDVHFVYTRYILGGPMSFRYNKRTYGVGWGVNDVLVVDNLESSSAPSLSIDVNTNNLYLFYDRVDSDHVYYIRCISGTWDALPTDWLDETIDDFYAGYQTNGYAQSYSNKIGLLYVTKTASPYNIKFAYRTVAAPQVGLHPSKPLSIINAE